MFNKYREVLSKPGALGFALAGVVARAPISMVGISLILAIRGIYGSYSLAGFLGAVQVIAFAVGAPILARLIDRHGQAQVMIPSIAVSATSMVFAVIGIINQISPVYLAILAAIGGAMSGSIGALVRSRWAYVLQGNPRELQAAYAMEAAFDELVFILGPVAATILAASVHPVAGLWAALALQVVGSYAFLFQTSTQPPAVEKKRQQRESVMRNPGMIVLAVTFAATGALFGSIDLSVVAFADAAGLPGMAGIILAVMSVGALLSAIYYGSRNWQWPLWKLFLIWVVLLSIGMSPFALATNVWTLGAMMFFAGLTLAPVMTNGNTIVQRITPANRLTEGLTWMATASTVGISMGSAISGPMVDNHGPSGGFLMTLIFAWVATIAAVLGTKYLRRSLETADNRPHIVDGDVIYNDGPTAGANDEKAEGN